MCRWTLTRHLLPLCSARHLYRGCERADRMVIDRVARQPVTALKPIPARNFRTKYSYSFKSRRYYWPALPASCFAEVRFSDYSNTLGRVDKKVRPRKTEKKSGYDNIRKLAFWKLGKVSKNPNRGKLKLLDTESASMVHVHSLPFFSPCISDALPKCNKPFPLVYCLADRNVSIVEREAIKHCILHSVFHDEIHPCVVTSHR